MWILFTGENLRDLRFKSSYVLLERPPGYGQPDNNHWGCVVIQCVVIQPQTLTASLDSRPGYGQPRTIGFGDYTDLLWWK